MNLMKLKCASVYKLNGKSIDYLPAAVEDQIKVKPVYQTFKKGWNMSTRGRNIEKLPSEAKIYIQAIEGNLLK